MGTVTKQPVTQQRIADELKAERENLTAYLKALPEGDWNKPSLCADWTIKDLLPHVVGIASDVANRRLDDVGSAVQNQRQVDERRDNSPAELLEEWAREGKLLEDGILPLEADFWNAPYSENFTVGQALQRMVEDIWVHTQDVRIPLGEEPATGPGLISTLEVGSRDLFARLPQFAPEVGTVTIVTGDFSSTVEGPGEVALALTGDPVTLGLVSTGRITLAGALTTGKLTVSPDAPAGFAKAINIYAA